MEHRLREGEGSCSYFIGLMDDGFPLGIGKKDMLYTLHFLITMAQKLRVEVHLVKVYQGNRGNIMELRIRQSAWDTRIYSSDAFAYIVEGSSLFSFMDESTETSTKRSEFASQELNHSEQEEEIKKDYLYDNSRTAMCEILEEDIDNELENHSQMEINDQEEVIVNQAMEKMEQNIISEIGKLDEIKQDSKGIAFLEDFYEGNDEWDDLIEINGLNKAVIVEKRGGQNITIRSEQEEEEGDYYDKDDKVLQIGENKRDPTEFILKNIE